MKQIPILQGKALLVEMPDVVEYKRIEERHIGCFLVTTSTSGELMVKLPPGNWRIIGMLGEVTEEQAVNLVEPELEEIDGKMHHIGWKDYETDCMYIETALESLESAILAENWYFENPVKVHTWANTWASENADDYRKQWEEGKKRVLDRSRCLLLGRDN